ncbi:hypothetical protein BATDEDRAFT_90380 [Batrachochytrium dendrobatidis JAM81]|uniref:Uncharacterized protein n=1 Tax=Batrachochytrium dendrobatidis (strain JAM81 / FGSC 10211) TaxID=684364 RepID=F4P7L7_BATDJ|nr:uncharacterized protein BATDEDRAFT_90380 [Batrachochytrium dendrobatidis JAM81]EGF78445.1 hypothetical protein BATDEDRAFT_90380 [Batrachochytrium dendrobatidis JAM81]|eukprot:XP_006680845.1 hypothetical protein BATDEDRAFT_90380 [Batrachochytrium dendrobatidis JAM81]
MFVPAVYRTLSAGRSSSRLGSSATAMLNPMRTNVSLIPPNVSSMRELGRLQSAYPQAHPEIFARMTAFYKAVPKGQANAVKPTTFWGKYYEKYVENDSLYPILHVIGVMIPIGFYIQYYAGGHYHPSREFH